jgi:putative endopeptidase
MRLQNVVPLLILAGGLYLAPKTAFGQILDSGLNLDAGPTSVPKKLKSLDLSAIDKTADPCTNFYQYACGNWVKDNPLPADQTHWDQVIQLCSGRNKAHGRKAPASSITADKRVSPAQP